MTPLKPAPCPFCGAEFVKGAGSEYWDHDGVWVSDQSWTCRHKTDCFFDEPTRFGVMTPFGRPTYSPEERRLLEDINEQNIEAWNKRAKELNDEIPS